MVRQGRDGNGEVRSGSEWQEWHGDVRTGNAGTGSAGLVGIGMVLFGAVWFGRNGGDRSGRVM